MEEIISNEDWEQIIRDKRIEEAEQAQKSDLEALEEE